MAEPICVLLLEDSSVDADLVITRLTAGGLDVDVTHVETREQYETALRRQEWDLVLGDYALPEFDGLTALRLLIENSPHTPFIFVSGVMGEDVAVDTLQRGAVDYVLKTRLERLVPSVRRALSVAKDRRERQRAEAALRDAETRYQHLVDDVQDYAILSIDTEGLIRTWNVGARQIFNASAADMLGQPLTELFTPSL